MNRNIILKDKKVILLCIMVLGLLVIGGYFHHKETMNLATISLYSDNPNVICDLDSGFYNNDIQIKLRANELLASDAEIFYTTNGDDPRDKGEKYSGSINITAEDETKTVMLKAVVCYKGEFSDTLYRSFFVGKHVEERYTCPVISIFTDNENLFDNEKGIFVPGITYQKYLDEGGNPEADMTLVPCNYNQRGEEWIRDAYLEAFTEDGEMLASQGIGLGVTGASSSGLDLKSLKLIANEIYDENNTKFAGTFWRDYDDITEYSHSDKFNKIKLKTGGQDSLETQMKWDLISDLAENAGLYPVAGNKKVIVYINGSYYGLLSMVEDYSAYNIGQECGLDSAYIEIIKENESVFRELFMVDLNEIENRNKLEENVDVEQLILYYAIQVMTNNVDWPENNYAIWRYTGDTLDGNPYSDGRYRFLLYDVDLAYVPENHWRKEVFPDIFSVELLDKLMDENKSLIFTELMKSEFYRNKFINTICDLNNTFFSADNVEYEIDILYEQMKNEIYQMESSPYNSGENWIDSFQANWDAQVKILKEETEKRYINLYDAMQSQWGTLENFQLTVEPSEGCDILVNTIRVYGNSDVSYKGNYFKNTGVTIVPDVYSGFTFKYWIVNGEIVSEEALILNQNTVMEKMVISAVCEKTVEKGAEIIINEIFARGSDDWIELYNTSAEIISLDNYYLSDDIDNLTKFSCQGMEISDGGVVVINGKSNNMLGAYQCNFNMRKGETLYLYRQDMDEIVDSVEIPYMSDRESYGRYGEGNDFAFWSTPTYGNLNIINTVE